MMLATLALKVNLSRDWALVNVTINRD